MWEFRKAALYWTLGIFFLAAYIMFILSEIPLDDFAQIADSFPKALQQFVGGEGGIDFGSVEGFLNAQIFTIMAPIMIIGVAINAGGKSTASEESIKSLDIVLSTPITRERFLIEKILSVITKVAFVSILHFVAYYLLGILFSQEVPFVGLLSICISLFLMGATFGMLGVMIGTLKGNPSQAIGISGGIALISYLIANIAPLVDSIDFTKYFSLFHYYKSGDPLKNGFHSWHWAPFVVMIIIFIISSIMFFRKRDLL
jgi:ABC-2 type transport system permease protein|tara:strand:+ start:1699 stop:2469 length:771 start_codon:yes stop_codon:yes gene_type:complete